MARRSQELLLAIRNAEVEVVKSILESVTQTGFDVYEAAEKINLICTAIEENQEEIVELLFKYADRKIAYGGCELALIKALETIKEDREALKLLLKAATSAKVFSEPIFDKVTLSDAFELSILKRKEQLVEVLLDRGAKFVEEIKGKNNKGENWLKMLEDARKVRTVAIHYYANEPGMRGPMIKLNLKRMSSRNIISPAVLFASPKILQLILDHWADVHDEDLIIYHVDPFSPDLFDFRVFCIYGPSFRLNLQEFKKKYKILIAYLAFLSTRGIFDENLRSLQRMLRNYQEIRKFEQECEKEIDSMKKETIENTVGTLFDICTTDDLNRLAAFAKNENIIEFLKSEDFEKKFPIYRDRMRWVLQKGFKRNFLLQRVCNFFKTLSITSKDKELSQLPATCVKNIFEFLTNRDLVNLRDA